MDIVSHLDLTEIFCDVDDFCQRFEQFRQQVPQLPSMLGEQRSRSRMHLSEVMTKGNCLSWLWSQNVQGFLHLDGLTPLAPSLPSFGQL
jgi:hypothetical protein